MVPEERRVLVGDLQVPSGVPGGRGGAGPLAQVAKDLGVNHETLRHWVRATERAEQPGVAAKTAKDAELARLRKEVGRAAARSTLPQIFS